MTTRLPSPRVAVIGAGIAGLSAAYHLRDDVELTIFEQNDYVGGHANTIEVDEDDRRIGIDTAFVVFNDRTYPQLSAFFEELRVPTLDHEGGFDFFDLDSGLRYGTAELDLDEQEVAARYPAEFMSVWREAQRFYQQSPRDFLRRRTDMSLGDYLDAKGYSEAFKHSYVVLLATAVWSVPTELIWEMPASTFIAFFMSHDPGGLGGRSVAWKTVGGGSISYVRRAVDAIGARLHLRREVLGVRDDGAAVTVLSKDGPEVFDYAVIGAHADQALRLIEQPTPAQQLLERVRYSSARAVLHTDPAVLPPDRSRWQSWNYGRVVHGGEPAAYVAYYMNRLQGFRARRDYFVTLDCPLDVREDAIIRDLAYTHPIIDLAVREMQPAIYSINDHSRIKLCGSYFHAKKIGPDLIGSHEAAFCSGVEAAKALRRELAIPSASESKRLAARA